jgi:hypothetical protein
MASEASLWIGLGEDSSGKHIGDRAFSRARAADDGDVERKWTLPIQIGANAVSHQRGRETDFARVPGLVRLPTAMLLEPAKVVGQLASQSTQGKVIHRGIVTDSA